jgi:hypothetical protein
VINYYLFKGLLISDKLLFVAAMISILFLNLYYANSYGNYVELEIRVSKFETNMKFKFLKFETTTLLGLKTMPYPGKSEMSDLSSAFWRVVVYHLVNIGVL